MGWANLSISSEISKIKTTARGIEKSDSPTSAALYAIAIAFEKIEKAMDDIAFIARNAR